MLPAATRRKLRIPHHVAILSAALCLSTAFVIDLYPSAGAPSVVAAKPSPRLERPETPLAKEEGQTRPLRMQLPRLFPWAPQGPTSQ